MSVRKYLTTRSITTRKRWLQRRVLLNVDLILYQMESQVMKGLVLIAATVISRISVIPIFGLSSIPLDHVTSRK